VTDSVTGVTLTTPQLTTPTLNQQFKNVDQPITLQLWASGATRSAPVAQFLTSWLSQV